MNKKPRRNKVKYPGLKQDYNLKIRQELLDQDYIDKLSEKEKQWLNNFNEEYIAANLSHPGKVFHKTKKKRKAIYDANNARNRDAFAITKSKDILMYSDVPGYKEVKDRQDTAKNETEDNLIALIDAKAKIRG